MATPEFAIRISQKLSTTILVSNYLHKTGQIEANKGSITTFNSHYYFIQLYIYMQELKKKLKKISSNTEKYIILTPIHLLIYFIYYIYSKNTTSTSSIIKGME